MVNTNGVSAWLWQADKVKEIRSLVQGNGISQWPDWFLDLDNLSVSQKQEIIERTACAPMYHEIYSQFLTLLYQGANDEAIESMIDILREEAERQLWTWNRHIAILAVVDLLKDNNITWFWSAADFLDRMKREEQHKIDLLLGSSPTDEPAAATVAEWSARTGKILWTEVPEWLS